MEGTLVGCEDLDGTFDGSKDSGDGILVKAWESEDCDDIVGASVAAEGTAVCVSVGCWVLGFEAGVLLGC